MKSVKRLEIIVERTQRGLVLDFLTEAGVEGWSILPVISGMGGRGDRGSDGLPGSLENDLILAAVEEGQLNSVMDHLRPVLERWGGVALVSDALWLKH